MNDTGNLQQATGCMTFLTTKTAALQQMAKSKRRFAGFVAKHHEAFLVIFCY